MRQKLGEKVWKITINKVVNAKSDLYKNGVGIYEYEIIGVSKHKICINDDFFTTFDYTEKKGQRKDSWRRYLNEISVKVKTKEDYFGSGIFTEIYSTKKPSKLILNKMVKQACSKIDKEYGFLLNGFKEELNYCVDSYKI
tara:strand:- start:213 stop:632 length:420 start_codon:yes stop_codon:yes gene_type:complete